MDNKEILALIGKFYLDIISLNSMIESQSKRISELEKQLELYQSESKDQ